MLSTLGPTKLGVWGTILGGAALQQGCPGIRRKTSFATAATTEANISCALTVCHALCEGSWE